MHNLAVTDLESAHQTQVSCLPVFLYDVEPLVEHLTAGLRERVVVQWSGGREESGVDAELY